MRVVAEAMFLRKSKLDTMYSLDLVITIVKEYTIVVRGCNLLQVTVVQPPPRSTKKRYFSNHQTNLCLYLFRNVRTCAF
jgi:hypothetical protein